MSFIKIICPKCNAETKLSLVDANYTGPRRCWKCHEAFMMTIANNQVKSLEPMSQEEFQKWQEEKKAADKAQEQGFSYAKREDTPARQEQQSQTQEKQEFFRPNIPNAPSTPKQTTGSSVWPPATFPPDKPNTFIPVEEPDPNKITEKKSQKPKDPPPDRFNIFIPPQT
jgi:hypothetical protein